MKAGAALPHVLSVIDPMMHRRAASILFEQRAKERG
jgi:hypothetical protein